MNPDKDWRPFEPCLENVWAARRVLGQPADGYVFHSINYTQEEMRIVGESSKWLNDVKNPTLLPQKETK